MQGGFFYDFCEVFGGFFFLLTLGFLPFEEGRERGSYERKKCAFFRYFFFFWKRYAVCRNVFFLLFFILRFR